MDMFEAFKRRVAAIEARPENRLAALRRELAVDAPVLAGSAEHARLLADGKLGRIVIAPDEPTPKEPIL
jgi:hypothetical protein